LAVSSEDARPSFSSRRRQMKHVLHLLLHLLVMLKVTLTGSEAGQLRMRSVLYRMTAGRSPSMAYPHFV
jgi:hypothetical protein